MLKLTNLGVYGLFHSEIVPSYDSSMFVMRKFSQLQQRADPVYSGPMDVGCVSWRLKVYPVSNLGTLRYIFYSIQIK